MTVGEIIALGAFSVSIVSAIFGAYLYVRLKINHLESTKVSKDDFDEFKEIMHGVDKKISNTCVEINFIKEQLSRLMFQPPRK